MEWVARAIGAFYVFAGIVVVRAFYMDLFLDRALAAISLTKPQLKDRARTAWLGSIALATLLSGAALLLLAPIAAPLFVIGAVLQASYLLWAARHVPPKDADDQTGRRRTTNAFVIYLAVTLFVMWLQYQGFLG